MELFDKTLSIVKEYSKKNNSDLYILFLPSKSQLSKNTSHPMKSDAMQIAKNNNFKVIDFEPIFRTSNIELEELFGTGHYSKLGYSLISDELNRIFNLRKS